jgi:hypothetical protein
VRASLSFLFEVRNNGKPLRVAYVGGTAIQFKGSAAYYDGYIASSKKMAKAAADYGATALMWNHSEFDDAYLKAHTAANRKPASRIHLRWSRMVSRAISPWSRSAPRLPGFGRPANNSGGEAAADRCTQERASVISDLVFQIFGIHNEVLRSTKHA